MCKIKAISILVLLLAINYSVSAQHWWTGAVNHSWNNGGNWDMGTVPGASDDVFIPSGTTNDCWVASTDQQCHNLFVLTGASLRIYDEILDVWGVCEFYGNLKMDNSNGELKTHQDIKWYSGSTANITAYVFITVYKNWIFNSGSNVQMDDGYVKFFGYSPTTITCKSPNSYFNTVSFENPHGVEFSSSSTAPLEFMNMSIHSGYDFISHSNQDIICNGQFSGYPGNFYFYNGTFVFKGATLMSSSVGNFFHNVTIDNYPGWVRIESPWWMKINGNLLINSGQIDADYFGYIMVQGHWTNNVGPTGYINEQVVEFFGPLYQEISSETFFKMYVDKTGGYVYPEEGGTIEVNYELDIQDGDFLMHNNSTLDLNGTITIANGSTLSCGSVSGAEIKYSGTSFDDNNTTTPGYLPGSNTFTFDHTSGYMGVVTDAPFFAFGDINIEGGGAVAINENIEVLGDVSVTNGSWMDYNFTSLNHNFYGDITVSGISNHFDDKKNIGFKGSTDQFIDGGSNGMDLGPLTVEKGSPSSTVYFSCGYSPTGLDVEGLTIEEGILQMEYAWLETTGNVVVNDGGKLALDAGSRLNFGNGNMLDVNSGGTFESIGSAGNKAMVSRISTGNYEFDINTGGTIAAKHTIFEYMDNQGVNVQYDGIVDTDYPFDYCTFRNGLSGGALMIMNCSHDVTIANAEFPTNTWSGTYNVGRTNNAGDITFWFARGDFAGEAYEIDLSNTVFWDDTPTLVSATVYLEGPFNGIYMNNDLYFYLPLFQPYNTPPWNYNGADSVLSIPSNAIIDWVLLELRTSDGDALSAVSESQIARHAAFLKFDGSIIESDGSTLLPFDAAIGATDNVYLAVIHRNHLDVMSANPLIYSSGVYSCNLSTSENDVVGGSAGHKYLGNNTWGMKTGDGNGDGYNNIPDIYYSWGSGAGEKGYYPGDFNMNNQVNNKDKNDFFIPNFGETSQVPD